MKTVIAATTLLATATAAPRAIDRATYGNLITKEIQGDLSWKTVHPNQNIFAEHTLDQVKSYMGAILEQKPGPSLGLSKKDKLRKAAGFGDSSGLPINYDSRQQHGSCVQSIRNQLHCGSCWAFAAAETLSDNLCIINSDEGNVKLSAQDLVSCDSTDHGCNGGTLPSAWQYLTTTGIVSDSCLPYTAGNGTVDTCVVDQCAEDSAGSYEKHKCPKSNMLGDTNAIKNGVMQVGSAETGFYVYQDFLQYKSGIYKHDPSTGNNPLGGHAVRIMGWGTDPVSKEDYWLVANSWGSAWGENGYFKISFDDKASAFAMGGGFNCGNLKPAPPAPAPAPGPTTCADLLPTSQCQQFKNTCANGIWGECKATCGCCAEFDKPAYCGNSNFQ
jgi:cathepsin B